MTKSTPAGRKSSSNVQEANDLPLRGSHHSRSNTEYDGIDGTLDLQRCSFSDVGFKGATLRGRITHSHFDRCYLRDAEFHGMDLTGTTFSRCNLAHASFDASKLDYVSFEDCQVDYAGILQNLPAQPNLKRHLLRSLRVNAAVRRDVDETTLLLAELAAEREELYATFTGANAYFRQKPGRERFRAFLSWSSHQFQRLVWGYGLQLRVLVRAAVIFIAAGAVLPWLLRTPFRTASGIRPLTFVEALFFSIGSFTTARTAEIVAVSNTSQLLVVFESLSGTAFLGLLAATAYRKIAR